MPKKKSSRAPKIATPPRRVMDGLYDAEALLEEGEPAEAALVLEELDRRHPGLIPVLAMLVDVYYEMEDMHGYEWACYRLQKIERSDPDLALVMAVAHMGNIRPALAIHSLEGFLRRWPDHDNAGEARQMLEKFRRTIQPELETLDMSKSEVFELAYQQDLVRLFMDHGQLHQARSAVGKLLKRYPTFVPALNNLSQIHALKGDRARAIELSRKTLEIEPHNVHTLSNLARLLFLNGHPDEASQVAGRMLESDAPAADVWVKKAEALSFLGDDQAILRLYRQAKSAGALELPEASPIFLHLVAVAQWSQGREKEARRLWQEALKLAPGFGQAQQQLDDLEKPVSQRNGPWAYPLNNWVAESTIRQLSKTVEKASRRKQDAAVQVASNKFLERHPDLVSLAPHLLERGDSAGCDFVIGLAGMSHHPDLLAALEGFVHSQRGRDEQRTNAAQILTDAGLLPSGPTRMWMQGEWQELLILNFEITPEPEESELSPEVQRLSEKAYYALRGGEPEKAQPLLEQAIAQEPGSPTLLNNLAMALQMQGDKVKAQAMVLDVHQRFPDYFFGIVSRARMAMQDGDLEKARRMVDGLMQRRSLHYSEFDALCMLQIDICLQEDNRQAARTWFDMWEQTDLENPGLEKYRLRVEQSDPSSLWKNLIGKERRRRQR
jgi:tetratricopeptide (TPR) repeat protein